jgi:hypothetical protein
VIFVIVSLTSNFYRLMDKSVIAVVF